MRISKIENQVIIDCSGDFTLTKNDPLFMVGENIGHHSFYCLSMYFTGKTLKAKFQSSFAALRFIWLDKTLKL